MVLTPKTWKEAGNECRKTEKGDLVSIHDMYLQAFIFSQSAAVAGSDWWIGLHRPARMPGKGVRWSDNTPSTFQFWKSGQKPDMGTNDSICVSEVNDGKFDGLWKTNNCSAKLPFVCQVYIIISVIIRGTLFIFRRYLIFSKVQRSCKKYATRLGGREMAKNLTINMTGKENVSKSDVTLPEIYFFFFSKIKFYFFCPIKFATRHFLHKIYDRIKT